MIQNWHGHIMYKIPRRSVYCDSLRSWVKEMFWIFLVMKLFRSDIEAICPPPGRQLSESPL